MNMPGFSADASLYRSASTYVTRFSGNPAAGEAAVWPQQEPSISTRLSRVQINFPELTPVWPPYNYGIQYIGCRFAIPRAVSACLKECFGQCVFSPDPQLCELGC
jgi:hypothetical protein